MTELAATRPHPEQREYLGTVKSSAEALLASSTTSSISRRSKRGKLDLERTGFDVRETLGEPSMLAGAAGGEKGIELACHVAPDVPDTLSATPAGSGRSC